MSLHDASIESPHRSESESDVRHSLQQPRPLSGRHQQQPLPRSASGSRHREHDDEFGGLLPQNRSGDEGDVEWRERMLETNRDTVDNVLTQAEDSIAKREEAIHKLREELRKLRSENGFLKEDNSRLQREVREADDSCHEKVRAERAKQSQILFEHQQAKEKAASELAALSSQLNSKFEDLRDLRERLALSESREEQLRASLQDMEDRQRDNFEEDANRIDDLRQQAMRANQYAAEMERKLGAALGEKLHAREHSDRSAKQIQQLQRKLSDTEQELVQLRSQIKAGALIDATEIRELVEEKQQLQDDLNAVHMNNVRLLRIISESNELSQFINFNEISNEFVFCGYRLLSSTSSNHVDPGEYGGGGGPAGLVGDSGVSGKINVVVGKAGAKSFNKKLSRGQANELREAIDEENIFLRQRQLDVAPLAKQPVEPLQRAHPEANYWIPHAVFAEAQKFKSRFLPNQSVEVFYDFLVEINKIWRARMTSRIEANKTRVRVQCEAKASKKKQVSNVQDDDRVTAELDGLRREVRQRFQNKHTLQLFGSYHNLARFAISRRIEAEDRVAVIAAKLNEAVATRDPNARNLDGALAALIANTDSVSGFMSEKILALVADVRLLMRNVAPDLEKNHLGSVNRVLDEFFSEIYSVTQESVRSLRKCSEGAEDVRSQCISRVYGAGAGAGLGRGGAKHGENTSSTIEYYDYGDEEDHHDDGMYDTAARIDPRTGVRTHYS